MEENEEIVEGEMCPYCHTKNLTLMEKAIDIPFFGLTHVFGMNCNNCEYEMSDLEADEQRKPVKTTLEISSEEDLKIRVVKSGAATIKIPRMLDIKPGANSNGYITNVEGLLRRIKTVFEELKTDDDKAAAKKAKNQLKKIQKVLWGQETIKITIEDKTGNSAFITEKAETK